ncbi:MAG TPA: chorismate-binding protein, partial [Longimicrobiales bacterium]
MISPSFEEFRDLARAGYDLIPVARRFPFDTRTAVTAYANLREPPFGFLLESVVGAEKWARYTFLGSAPREVIRARAGELARWTKQSGWQPAPHHTDVLTYLQQRLAAQRVAHVPGLPRFFGGVVGYIGYDVVRSIEHLPRAPVNDLGLPEAVLMFTDVVLAIDNVFGHACAIACAEVPSGADDGVLRTVYDDAVHNLDTTIQRVHAASTLAPLAWHPAADEITGYTSSWTRADFEAAVEKIRDYIAAGDVFQVVLSQRLAMPLTAPPFELYRGLRSLNPSPYLFFLELDDLALVGSSPEVLVRAEQGRVIVRPIAGTRRRGRDEDEDARLADDLKRDAKERAEHLMLVDLG